MTSQKTYSDAVTPLLYPGESLEGVIPASARSTMRRRLAERIRPGAHGAFLIVATSRRLMLVRVGSLAAPVVRDVWESLPRTVRLGPAQGKELVVTLGDTKVHVAAEHFSLVNKIDSCPFVPFAY